MQINPQVPFIPEAKLEEVANTLLDRYAWEIEPIAVPPVPVEKIADFLLDLSLEWLDIPDTAEEPILAYLRPGSKTIRLNERWLAYFEHYPGTYEYTLAHEIGHYQLHVTTAGLQSDQIYVYRYRQTTKDRREWQAERFASYLLMPAYLLLPAIKGINLQRWPELYRLRDQFKVSITALTVRLEELGYLYVAGNGRLYPTKGAATGDRRRESQSLLGQAKLFSMLGHVEQAKDAYRLALEIVRELGDRRNEAFVAWQLGLLYAETDPARAAALMSDCVAYEREIGHAAAQADAELVARLRRQVSGMGRSRL
jgi:hypothetical protein